MLANRGGIAGSDVVGGGLVSAIGGEGGIGRGGKGDSDRVLGG